MRSLRARLFAAMAATIVAAGFAGGAFTYNWAFEEAIETQDGVLLQVGMLAEHNRLTAVQATTRGVDPDARVAIEELGFAGSSRDAGRLIDGLQILRTGGEKRRAFVLTRVDGSRLVVSQSTAYRTELARGSAWRAVLPFVALVPCLMLLIGLVIRQSFEPVSRLAARLDDARSAQQAEELPTEGMPNELLPFIASINRLLQRHAAMLERQRRFVADAAHELRSPITALSLQAENLARSDRPQDGDKRLAALQTGIRRTAHLLEQLIDMARYDEQRTNAPATRLDEVAKEIVAEFSPSAEARSVDLGFTRVEAALVPTDRVALRVLIRNIVDNALRHTPDAGRIDIDIDATGKLARLCILDTGPGMSTADRDRAFEPFFRGGAAVGDGTGLGLSIARRIVESAGGTIELGDGAEGRGLRVTMNMPLSKCG